jgi:peptidoglycan/xylan/chitin deacetylase (PgdA/CDA1 family)
MKSISGVALIVPFYHVVSDEFIPHVSHLYRFRTVADFTEDLEFFLRYFAPVTLDDIVEALNGSRILPRSCFHLTFDDGFREVHEIVAPILERAGVPATFFLETAFLDGGGMAHHNEISVLLDRMKSLPGGPDSMNSRLEPWLPTPAPGCRTVGDRMLSIKYAQRELVRDLASALEVDLDEYIRARKPYLTPWQVTDLMRRGFAIGSHSCDHPLYADLPLSEQLRQTRDSVNLLRTRFAIRRKAFAFPHNDSGVEREFFMTLFGEQSLDVSFGTSGLVPHFDRRNIQRVSMEKTTAPAEKILARQFTRAAYFRMATAARVHPSDLPATTLQAR